MSFAFDTGLLTPLCQAHFEIDLLGPLDVFGDRADIYHGSLAGVFQPAILQHVLHRLRAAPDDVRSLGAGRCLAVPAYRLSGSLRFLLYVLTIHGTFAKIYVNIRIYR